MSNIFKYTRRIINKNKNILLRILIFILIFTIFVVPILAIHFKYFILILFKTKENAVSYLQYFGTIVGGTVALIAVISSWKQTKKVMAQNSILILNQTIIPKCEELIILMSGIEVKLAKITRYIEELKFNYEKNKGKEINGHDIDKMHESLRHAADIMFEMKKDIDLFSSLSLYAIFASREDMSSPIFDKYKCIGEYISNATQYLPIDDFKIIDTISYNLCIDNLNNILNVISDTHISIGKIIRNVYSQISRSLRQIIT